MNFKVKIGDFRPSQQEIDVILDVIRSGRISEGDFTRTFEREWARYIGTKHCVATNSGTSALMAGLSVNDEVEWRDLIITTPLTYIATSNAILNTGHEPLYGDVDEYFGLRVDETKRLLEENLERVYAILVVHLMGFPCYMDQFRRLAEQYDVLLIEDCAQAHGATFKGRRVGAWGDWSIFSFYISHNIQAGEMGCVMTNNERMDADLRRVKYNGTIPGWPRFQHDLIGYNFKVTEFQSALAVVQIQRAERILKKRRRNFQFLYDNLKDIDGLKTYRNPKGFSPLGYPMVVEDGRDRDSLLLAIEKRGVETRPLYGCIPTQQPAFAYLKRYEGRLPMAERLGSKGFYLPVHQYLSRLDLHLICDAVRQAEKETRP